MGTLFSTLSIARSGLQVAQVQLDTAGHNIANVNKTGFSRQRVELIARVPITTPQGQIGRGVEVTQIIRLRDTFLDALYRRQAPGLGNAEIQAEYYTRIQDVFLEPTENGISNRLNLFFNSLNEFANNVEELPVRQSVINEAQALSSLFRETAERLDLLRSNANEEIQAFVPQINSLATRIASLNQAIRDSELGGQPANDLRDDRDVLLDQLSRLGNTFVRERSDGQVTVLFGGEVLVDERFVNELEAVISPALDPERGDLYLVRYADTLIEPDLTDGELFGAIQQRDVVLVEVDDRIDQLAATIIEQINRIHSQGNGLQNLSGTVTGSNAVSDPTVALDSADLPFTVQDGSFDVAVVNDTTGAIVGTATINVTANTTTLNDIAAALGGVNANLGAAVSGNALELTSAAGFSFTFSNDTSGTVGALGVNTLFTGFDARTIDVNALIEANGSLLASGFSTTPLDTGDNRAALALANVQNGQFLDGNTQTINDFYETTIVNIGVDAQSNNDLLEVERAFVQNFDARRQEISGVSLDEEATLLIQFQRAFEASARVVTVTDRMLDALLIMGA